MNVEPVTVSSDRGAAGVGAIALGILTFAIGALLLSNAWAIVDARMAASSAAREGVRAFVVAESESDAYANAQSAVNATLTGYGRDPAQSDPLEITGEFARCEWVTLAVTYHVPTIALGDIANWGTISTTGEYTEIMDPYRSGLEVPDDPLEAEECAPE